MSVDRLLRSTGFAAAEEDTSVKSGESTKYFVISPSAVFCRNYFAWLDNANERQSSRFIPDPVTQLPAQHQSEDKAGRER